MTGTPRPYAGSTVAFGTQHGKAELAAPAFRGTLGAEVVATEALDTDALGTFAGDIPRTLTPRAAARVKARLATVHLATPFALASEGSFGGGFGPVGEHHELLLFVDLERGLEVVESVVNPAALGSGRPVDSVDAALEAARRIGWPDQAVLLRGGPQLTITRYADDPDALARAIAELLALGPIRVDPDHRAHRSPSRAAVIRDLAERMARRLATLCPACGTPGFGRVDVERGLPCAECGEPTRAIAADIWGCGACPHTERRPRPERTASPAVCDGCNP